MARVNGAWITPLPPEFTTADAMAIGTAGYTAMLAILALERHGVGFDTGPVIVTGASGGVGSMAVALLSRLGYQVVRGHREVDASRLPDVARRRRNHRPRGTSGDTEATRQGALGGRYRRGRRAGPRQRPVDDDGGRRGGGLRQRRRLRAPDLGRAVHPPRRVAARDRIVPAPRRSVASRRGPASPATSTATSSQK